MRTLLPVICLLATLENPQAQTSFVQGTSTTPQTQVIAWGEGANGTIVTRAREPGQAAPLPPPNLTNVIAISASFAGDVWPLRVTERSGPGEIKRSLRLRD